jgi:hypothetical protein
MDCAFNKSENKLYIKDPDIENENESDIKTDKAGKKYIPVIYDNSELAALEGKQIPLGLHLLKKIFKGTIEIYKEVAHGN